MNNSAYLYLPNHWLIYLTSLLSSEEKQHNNSNYSHFECKNGLFFRFIAFVYCLNLSNTRLEWKPFSTRAILISSAVLHYRFMVFNQHSLTTWRCVFTRWNNMPTLWRILRTSLNAEFMIIQNLALGWQQKTRSTKRGKYTYTAGNHFDLNL